MISSSTTTTSLGTLLLWLCVAGMRRILAASDVRTGSALSPSLLQTRLSLLATGSHSSRDTGLSRGQYTCTPLPELTSIGSGRQASTRNSSSAPTAASCDG